MQLAKKITVDREGLLIDGERLPYYVADPVTHPLVVETTDGMCWVTVTLLADEVEVDPTLQTRSTPASTRVIGMGLVTA